MRTLLAGLVTWALFAFLSVAVAQQTDQNREDGDAKHGIEGELCFGDKYETDEDLNDGNRISDEEIRRILNPPSS